MSDPFRIVLFEPEAGGHQASHVSHVVEYLLAKQPALVMIFALGGDLIDLLPDHVRAALESPEPACCTLWRLPDEDLAKLRGPKLLRRGLHRWFYVKRLARRLSADHAHFHFFDHAMFGAALPLQGHGKTTFSGLLFRPSVHYSEIGSSALRAKEQWRDRAKVWLYDRVLSNARLTGMLLFDRYLPAYAASHFARGDKVVFVPDPVPVAPQDYRVEAPPMSPERVSFLLFGALSERKGILVTADALDLLPDALAARCHVRFAGRVDKAVRDEFKTRIERLEASGKPVQIEVLDRYLDDHEIPPMIGASDVILAPYVRHVGSSGVLYWAAAAGKPIITQDYGLIAREAEDFSLGLTADTLSAESLANALAKAIQARDGIADAAGQARFIEGHTTDAFAEALVAGMSPAIHRIMSLPGAAAERPKAEDPCAP